MTKLSRKRLDPKYFGDYINNLWSAFTLSGTKDDIKLLFKDLFTHTEYKMFAKRFEIARRLMQGQSYEQIKNDVKVTDATVSKVSNILAETGDGFRKAHENLTMLEEKLLSRQRERTKNLENPLRKKLNQKTVLGNAIKVGLRVLDRKVTKALKERTAAEQLEI